MGVDGRLRELMTVPGVRHRQLRVGDLSVHLAEAGEGEPLLLLHGFVQHWWEWRGVIPLLAERYRVVCPDLRGFGWTAAPRRGYTREQLRDDAVGLLDALGVDRAGVVGHDIGALVTIALATDAPERISGQALLAVPPPFIRMSARMLPAMPHLWFQGVLAAPGLGTIAARAGGQALPRHLLSAFGRPELWTEEVTDAFTGQFRQWARARAASAVYRQLVLPEFARILGGAYRRDRLEVPTLVLFGAADGAFPPPLVRHLAREHERYADHFELDFVEGGSHFLVDDEPAGVAHRLDRFFSTLPTVRSAESAVASEGAGR